MFQTSLRAPIGKLLIEGTRTSINSIRFVPADTPVGKSCALLNQARRQLREYFRGTRASFDLPLDLGMGTEFQRAVWQHIAAIPYGQTATYLEIARLMSRPVSQRAVGRAVASNPLMIVVPCHRVLSADGRLTGYAGGLKAKEWLLRHEGALIM
jgi:methylated-DNA-[protein]-cysteine S-methyltransferase